MGSWVMINTVIDTQQQIHTKIRWRHWPILFSKKSMLKIMENATSLNKNNHFYLQKKSNK